MTLNRHTIIWILAGILFAVASLWIHHQVKVVTASQGTAVDRLGDLVVGGESPDFSSSDLQGEPVVLSEFENDKVVVVDFWATWCGPCLMAMPALQDVAIDYQGQVEILAVNLGEDPERARRFMERKGYTFRVVKDQDSAIAQRFGVTSIPSLLVVGIDGRIEWIRVGYNPNEEGLREVLERLTQAHSSSEDVL